MGIFYLSGSNLQWFPPPQEGLSIFEYNAADECGQMGKNRLDISSATD